MGIISAAEAQKYAKTPGQKEWAREMLMFPLSVKNPYTPLMGKRSKKIMKPPRKDKTYHLTGPERFLDLNGKELRDVMIGDSLESASSTGSGSVSALDKVLNCIPFYGFGYYRHPSYNYGRRYHAAFATDGANDHSVSPSQSKRKTRK